MAKRPYIKPVATPSRATQHLLSILTELNSAFHNWALLGDEISQGYSIAYEQHTNALKQVAQIIKRKHEMLMLPLETMYFVLQTLSLGYAGGLAAGYLTPWKKALEVEGRYIIAEVGKGLNTEAAKAAVKQVANIGEFYLTHNKGSGDAFIPVMPTPGKFDLDMRTALDHVVVSIQDPLIDLINLANAKQWDASVGMDIQRSFQLNCPLLTDVPRGDEIPKRTQIARPAELAMWVAWANVRDWSYWGAMYGSIPGGDPGASWDEETAVDAVQDLDPVLARLVKLNAGDVTMMGRKKGDDAIDFVSYTLLDLRRLAYLPLDTPDLPFTRLTNLAEQWNKDVRSHQAFLSNLQKVPPGRP